MSTSYQCCTITMNYHYYLLSTAIVFYIISILLEVYHAFLCYLMLQQLIAGQFRVFHPVNVNIMKESTFVSGKYSTQNLTHVNSLMILTMQITLTFSVVYHHRLWLKERLAQSLKPQQKCWQLTQSCSFFSSFYHQHQWKERSNWDQWQPCVYQSLGGLLS